MSCVDPGHGHDVDWGEGSPGTGEGRKLWIRGVGARQGNVETGV